MLDGLDIAPRLGGRAPASLEAEALRELTLSDLALLQVERGTRAPSIKKLRDRHHALARCLAQGMKNSEASAVTGYDPSRISILLADPTFQDLLEHYKKVENSHFADFTTRATLLSLDALNELQERLEDDPESFTQGDLRELIKLTADRTGHAPVQKVQQTNINVELGGRLAQARARIIEARQSLLAEGSAGSPTSEPLLETSFSSEDEA